MVVNTQQYEYTPQQRELTIIKYIRGHQGCTKSDITRGLKGIISKTHPNGHAKGVMYFMNLY